MDNGNQAESGHLRLAQNSFLALSFPMLDILKMLSDLRQERESIGEEIIALKRLAMASAARTSSGLDVGSEECAQKAWPSA